MGTLNVTDDGRQENAVDTYCSVDLTGGIRNQLIVLYVLNIFLSIAAFLGNTLILVALRKECSLNPPSKLLFRCLAITDLCVGLVSEPLSVTGGIAIVNQRWNICRHALTLSILASTTLCSVSLLTLTAISVDRLLALSLGLRYRQVVTLRRTYVTVIIFWVQSIIGATMYLWNHLTTLWYSYIGILLCLITSTVSYTIIFLKLRHNQTQVQVHGHQEQPNQTIPLNIARYKKAVSSALWLQLTLVFCYLPYVIVQGFKILSNQSSSLLLTNEFTGTLVYLNSSLNPILYCWKMKNVRQAVKNTVNQVWCSSN